MSVRRPLLLVVALALALLAVPSPSPDASTGTKFVSHFTIALPVSAAGHEGLQQDLDDSDAGGEEVLPLAVTGSLVFPSVDPAGGPVSTTLTLTNEGAAPIALQATATALVGPDDVVISSSHLGFHFDEAAGDLSGAADLGVLGPGETAEFKLTLTPPDTAFTHLPAGDYVGTLDLIGEVTTG